jgi:dephospho-CoA kinase
MEQDSRPTLVGLTGGIASGKSTVCAWLTEHGYSVAYADRLAHLALQDENVIQEIAARFGGDVLRDGAVDRRKLADVIFSDDAARLDLNAIVHPRVLRMLDMLMRAGNTDLLIVEVPLLFESRLQDCFDATVTVEADRETRLRALMQRDGLDRARAEARLRAQLTEDERVCRADRVLRNPMTMPELARELEDLTLWLKKVVKREVKCFTEE